MLPPKTFDRDQIARNLARRRAPDADFVTPLVLEDLADRLLTVTRTIGKAVILAPDASALPQVLSTKNGAFPVTRVSTALATPDAALADPEALSLPETGYDLIVSVLDLQVINDVPGFLSRVRAHLAPDGLFMAAFLGGLTLTELRQAFLAADAQILDGAFARVAPFIQLGDAGGLMQRAGFALPVTDVETHTVRYADALALMRDLKALGASNPLAERPSLLARPVLLAAASAAYAEIAGDPDGRVRATLEIVWLSGWAPHESQQKPLAPGSAKVSLKSVLGNKAGG
jgi:hypothetical protein